MRGHNENGINVEGCGYEEKGGGQVLITGFRRGTAYEKGDRF